MGKRESEKIERAAIRAGYHKDKAEKYAFYDSSYAALPSIHSHVSTVQKRQTGRSSQRGAR